MKALLLIEDDLKALEIAACINPVGFEVIRYRNPLKALDNLDEIAPDAIIASALDFPRHWKIIADVVRAAKDRHACSIVILRGEHFGTEEADKATHLGVNGIVSDRISEPHARDHLVRLLGRYSKLRNARTSDRVQVAEWDRCIFLFVHPHSGRILGGRVATISATGLSFEPDDFEAITDLEKETILKSSSLRVGDNILSLDCRIVRTGSVVGLSFGTLDMGQRAILDDWLAKSLERELAATASGMLIVPEP